jgi:KaiC/GvpD/RAD55 family RecA-like ATPase
MDGRLKSGIPGLDELLGGGFPVGGTYAVAGYPGTGKSIFSTQVLHFGAKECDEPGVYLVLEEDKDRMMSNMKSFGWDLKPLEDDGMLRIIPYTRSLFGDAQANFEKQALDGAIKSMDELRQFLTVDSIFHEIEDACKELGARRLLIDPITTITLLADNQVVSRMQLIFLIQKLRKLNVTTLATIEEGIGSWGDVLFLADGLIRTMLKEKSGIYQRGLVIEKMRGTAHDTGIRPFRITSQGIKVYPSETLAKE